MEDLHDLLEWTGSLLLAKELSDLTLIVEGEAIRVLRTVLADSCEYFRALLCGDLKESRQSEIILNNIPLRGFKLVLRYIYNGRLELKELNGDTILEILEISNLYGLDKLRSEVCEHLKATLSVENVCIVYGTAQYLELEHLCEACFPLMDLHPDAILGNEAFYHLTETAITRLLSRDTFCAEEIEIFKAVQQWCAENSDLDDHSKVIATIRLPLIAIIDLATTVRNSGLVAVDLLWEAIRFKESHPASLPFRGVFIPKENLANEARGAMILKAGASRNIFTPKACPVYEAESMPSNESNLKIDAGAGLTIALSRPFLINHIAFRLSERTAVSYSYYVEVSVSFEDWVRVIDHSKYPCRSAQRLYFEPRVVRYVRIMPSVVSAGVSISLSMFEVSHSGERITFNQGFYAPKENVATTQLGATVIECGGGIDKMISATSPHDYGVSGGTWYRMGCGSITIQLAQPYAVNFMRMLLHTTESRGFSFYIETSLDKTEWTRVVDRTAKSCCYWHDMEFVSLPVVFIKIVATSAEDEYFECSGFECRAIFDSSSVQAEGGLDGIADGS